MRSFAAWRRRRPTRRKPGGPEPSVDLQPHEDHAAVRIAAVDRLQRVRHAVHRIEGAEAEADGALSQYEQQVLLALEESENAFSDYAKRQQRLISLVRQAEASRAAAEQAAIRYREGTVDFLVLLDAERERLAAEDAQASAEVELYSGIVAIYKALGGGWQPQA